VNLNDIDYLVAVAEQRHVGRAAEALGLTQPALTRAIARLEAQAGMPLFERHPKGVMLTTAGEAFLHRAQRIRIEYDDALREMHQMKTGEMGILRIGYSPSLDDRLLMSVMRRMLLERPAARIHLTEKLMQYLLDMLLDGQLDLVVAPAPVSPPAQVEVLPLYQDVLHVIADLEHPLQRRRDLQMADLAAQPWLLPAPHTPLRTALNTLVLQAGLPELVVRVEVTVISLNNVGLLRGTRMLGIGSHSSLEPLRREGIGALPISLPVLRRQIALLLRKDAYQSPLSQRFRQLLLTKRGSTRAA